jgi:hypothetical protein
LRSSLDISHDHGGMVAADIKKAAKNAITSSDNDNRLAGYFAGNVLARLNYLGGTSDDLPRAWENCSAFQLQDPRINIPSGRWR